MLEKLAKLQLIWLAVILALGFVVSAKVFTSATSKDSIYVTGSAFKIVKSDSARLEFNINLRKPTKTAAYNEVKKQIPVVIEFLHQKGLTDENIEQKAANGYYSYRYDARGNNTNEIAYYNYSQPFVIKSDDVNKIKDISVDIQSLTDKDIDISVYSPEYFYSNLSDLKVELLKEATADAKQRASAMLKATHNRPGKIQSVQMGVFQITPADSTNVSDMGISDTTTIDKKVTSVANIRFQIK